MIEIMTGLFALCVALKFGLNLTALAHFIFIAVLTVITYIDLDHFIIPDVLSLPGIPVFFLLSFLNPQMNWLDSLIGILVGGGILYLIAFLYTLVTGKEGMGGGDIKLLAMIGAFVGLKGVVFTIFVSSLIGTISGLVIMIAKGKDFKLKIPFGPFLAIGAISYVFFGNYMIRWYFNMAAA
jgi:leader peptidase (prepilin peptidase)/N-methyltransferase